MATVTELTNKGYLRGGRCLCQDTLIPEAFTHARFCRIADGPDEVHMSQLGKMTMRELNA